MSSLVNNRRLRRTALAVALGLSFSGAAFAQSNASGVIYGHVEAAPGSTIQLQNIDTGQTRTITVGTDGSYRASSLAVGRYNVTLQRDGQAIATRQNVAVQINSGVDVSFAGASAGNAQTLEGVQVVASALPAIDVTSMDSRTVLTADQLAKIPVAHSVTAAALLAPGVIGADSRYGNIASFGGSSAAENQYYVNGFPVTNALTGLGFTELPFDAIDQQQVLTGGYGAEYGRSTGGVVNIVTKSGTNVWKAGAQVMWRPRALEDSPRDIYYPKSSSEKSQQIFQDRSRNTVWDTNYAAYISGPLIKDKLFLYATGEFDKQGGSRGISSEAGATMTQSTNKITRWLAKINWNITDNNILEFTGLGDSQTNDATFYSYDYDTGTRGNLLGTEYTKNRGVAGSSPGGNMYVAKYTGYLTDNLTVTALYGKTHSDHVDTPLSTTGVPCPLVADARGVDPSYNSCNSTSTVLSPGANDDTKGWRLDIEYQAGDHHLRAGVDTQDIDTYSGITYAGGIANIYRTWQGALAQGIASYPGYVAPATPPDYVVQQQIINFTAGVSVKQQAQYIEDKWQINDRWLASIGLRNEQFSNYNSGGTVYVSQRHQLAPRLSLTWDVFGDSTMKVFANAGRYHLAIPANVAIRGASATLFQRQFFTYTDVDPVTGAPSGLTPITGIRYANGEDGVTVPDPRTVAAKGIKAYYQDEYILGFEKAFGSDWTFGAKAIYRNLGSIIDDFCDAAPFQHYADRNGIDITNARISGCYLFNPGGSNTFVVDTTGNGDYQDFKLTKEDFAGNPNGIGYPDLERKYLALDVFLTHQFSNNWYGKVEYVWSKNYGDAEGMLKSDIGQTDPSVTQDWDFPELMIGSRGYLPNDRRHQIKAYGFWQMTPEWLFGANAVIASGRPKNCIGNSPVNADGETLYDREGYGSSFFFCDKTDDGVNNPTPAPRGSQGRLPWTYRLDLSAQYTPAWADHKLTFMADVFNVFSQQRALSIVETKADEDSPTYGRVISYQTPRYFRLGVRYDFSF